jgi:hypothetical protein
MRNEMDAHATRTQEQNNDTARKGAPVFNSFYVLKT